VTDSTSDREPNSSSKLVKVVSSSRSKPMQKLTEGVQQSKLAAQGPAIGPLWPAGTSDLAASNTVSRTDNRKRNGPTDCGSTAAVKGGSPTPGSAATATVKQEAAVAAPLAAAAAAAVQTGSSGQRGGSLPGRSFTKPQGSNSLPNLKPRGEGRWQVFLCAQGLKYLYVGQYNSLEEAIPARDLAVLAVHGESAAFTKLTVLVSNPAGEWTGA
jgi:hypothetical protein